MEVTTPDFAQRLDTIVGEMLFVRDSSMARSLLKNTDHDPGVRYFMEKHIDRLFPFFDVGANVGYFTNMARKLGSGEILCFEPDERNLELLDRNLPRNRDGILVYPVGCTDKDGEISMGSLDCGVSRKSRENIQTFPGRSLKSIIDETGVVPGFVKIDIEGAETLALSGMENAVGWANVILEFEYSFRDHGSDLDRWRELRPTSKFNWEFLLSKSELRLIKNLEFETLELSQDRVFYSATVSNDSDLEIIAQILAASTAEWPSRKWELCISPR